MAARELLQKISRCMVDESSRLTDEWIRTQLTAEIEDTNRFMGGGVKLERYLLEVLLSRQAAGDTHWQLMTLADVFLEIFESRKLGLPPLPALTQK